MNKKTKRDYFNELLAIADVASKAELVAFINQNYIVPTSNSNWSYLIFSIIIALLVIFNHRANVQRILNGTENRISFKK